MTKIFLSYARQDATRVETMYVFLEAMGYNVWMDTHSLPPGIQFPTEIEKALEQSDYCVACLSNVSVDKYGYVQFELKRALEELDKYPEGRIFLIPARLEDCEVPHSMRNTNWVDMFQPGAMLKLLQAFMHPELVVLDHVHQQMCDAELFSPKHNDGRIAYKNGTYDRAEQLAKQAYDEIPNPHSKLNQQVAIHARRTMTKRELDRWVYKLKLESSGHGRSVLARGY